MTSAVETTAAFAVTTKSLVIETAVATDRHPLVKLTRIGLITAGLLAMTGCHEKIGSNSAAPAPASTGLVPAAAQSQSGAMTLEQYNSAAAAGASVSQSPHYILMNQGASR